MNQGNNRGSVFDPAISVEAWRAPCTNEKLGSVHVDITFLEARLGEEPESKVRFRLSLKSVVLKVTASSVDPIRISPSSVDRGNISTSQFSETASTSLSVGGSASLNIGTGPIPVSGALAASADGRHDRTKTITTNDILRPHKIEQFKIGESYCWSIDSQNGGSLEGKVWDPVSEPRCSVVLTSQNAQSQDCEVRLDVECKREDISLEGIQLKEGNKLKLAFGRDNNFAAAEAVLRHLLAEKGFLVRNIHEPFENVPLTSISIGEDVHAPLA